MLLCFQAKIPCSNLCRCVGCKNFEDSPDRQTLLHLADAAEVRVQQQAAAETKFSSHVIKPPVRPAPPPAGMERLYVSCLCQGSMMFYCSYLTCGAGKLVCEGRSSIPQE